MTAALVAGGELKVTGDDQDNNIVISRTAGGTILVNNGAIPIVNGPATIANTNHLHLVGADGNDNISLDETNGALPDAALFGGTGNDSLVSGSGIDFIQGEAGNDTILMGASDDTFSWNPGDGSDVVDGQAGSDDMVFNGNNLAEQFNFTDTGVGSPFHHLQFTRDVGSVSLDLNRLETISLNTFGGADIITVNDQAATDLTNLNIDLNGASLSGDGEIDSITINGTEGDDIGEIGAFDANTRVGALVGVAPFVNITGSDGATDKLTVNELGGNDGLDALSLPGGLIGLSVNGGADNDTIEGSDGNDAITGGAGNDSVLLGAGDDSFVWNAGDGSDIVEGNAGTDTINFNGSNDPENIDVAANGSRLRITRDIGNVVMDVDGFEQVAVAPFGGADNVVVNDLAGTAVTHVKVKLNGDGLPDSTTINASNVADAIVVGGDFSNGVTISGLAAQVQVVGAIGASESLIVNALGGADTIDASALQANTLNLALNGGAGADTFTASEGDDVIDGGTQTDTINVVETASNGITVLPSSGDDTINVNTDGAGVANVGFNATQRIGALNIGSGGRATLTSGGAKVLVVTTLNISGTGKLNLNDNDLIIDYSDPSPLATIKTLLASGFHGSAWDGNGINSSSAAAATATALGYAQATDLFLTFPATFDGQSIDSSSIMVRYTRAGDANLDRRVNALDFNAVASNFGGSSRNWVQGNFNYDNTVNSLDFIALAVNFGASLPSPAVVQSAFQSDPPPLAAATVTPRTLFSGQAITPRFDLLANTDLGV